MNKTSFLPLSSLPVVNPTMNGDHVAGSGHRDDEEQLGSTRFGSSQRHRSIAPRRSPLHKIMLENRNARILTDYKDHYGVVIL